ncbi:MAG: tRNA (adenosine(37)-N6)-threonylcarbamoyltransferase complex dimerization subunit type 1 TsaB [Rubrobacteraceae bacterium]
MLILAFDASTPVITVALAREEEGKRQVLAEISATSGGASEVLLRSIHKALELTGENLESVGRILVGVGPGTFTGIRIAASTARSLSQGTGITLARNSTLSALASPALSVRQEVLAVLDAKRGQVFAQRFTDGASGEILCVTPDQLISEDEPLIVGDGAVRYRNELSELGTIPPDASPLHRVTATGHVLSADLSPVRPEDIVPLYVREPDAEVRRDLNPWSS